MHMIKWLAANDIKAVHQYLPRKVTALKKYHIAIKTSGPLMYVYENAANNFLLFRGINAYNSLSVLCPNKKVPCIIIRDNIQEFDWHDACLLNCVKENVYYRIKDEIIQTMLTSTNNDTKRIAKLLNCSEDKIRQHYIINKKLPDKIKRLIDEKGRTKLVNAIFNDLTFSPYQHLLVHSATIDINRLTEDKLKYFKWYINAGYSLDQEENNLTKQLYELNKIVDLKEAFNTYWFHLEDTKMKFSIRRKYNHNAKKKKY